MFRLLTPGGGGYGTPDLEATKQDERHKSPEFLARGSVHEYQMAQESVWVMFNPLFY